MSARPCADTAITWPVWAKHPFGADQGFSGTCRAAVFRGQSLAGRGSLPPAGTASRNRQLSLAVQTRRSWSSLITIS
jgi:hypothetical protein